MQNTMKYKGYVGSVEYSEADGLLFGQVLAIRGLILYEGKTVDELVEDFHDSIDEYLLYCEESGIEPEKPYKGSFNVRIAPELHRDAALYAISHNISLNSFVESAVKMALAAEA